MPVAQDHRILKKKKKCWLHKFTSKSKKLMLAVQVYQQI